MAESSNPANDEKAQPSLRDNDHFHADKYGSKLVDQAEKLEDKAHHHVKGQHTEKEKGPAGGFDSTPIPKAPPGYTIKITFHSAHNLPFADLDMTSDPYIHAVLKTDLAKRHKQDPDLMIRTPTIHRNTNPIWDVSWTIAHIPASGFKMKCRLYDEDPRDHDDRLGNVHVEVSAIDEQWKGFKEQSFRVKKRMGSKRAYTLRGCASLLNSNVKMDGEVIISVENLGKSDGDNGGQPYTVGPLAWSEHHSPLIGMIAGTKEQSHGKAGGKKTERYNFQAIQMQLAGPVPEALYHRYVEFRPFISGMFTSHTIKGRILNSALHHQHARIYNFDETTKYGSFDEPSHEMTARFLEFLRYDQGGRIFTYVITLDGQFRFTETGKEFGIDMLSKHSMHSDVSVYIAFSGEFFIRRLKHPHKSKKATSPDPASETLPPATEEEEKNAQEQRKEATTSTSPQIAPAKSPSLAQSPPGSPGSPSGHGEKHLTIGSKDQRPDLESRKHRSFSLFRRGDGSHQSDHSHASPTHEAEDPPKDVSHYELIIDNDSGTYRPNSKYLPQLKKFLRHNFPGLKVATLDCQADEEKMKKLKTDQRERKKKSGQQIMYMQNSSLSSFSSSDEEELEKRASATGTKTAGGTLKKKIRNAKSLLVGDDDDDNHREKNRASTDDKKVGADKSDNKTDSAKPTEKPSSHAEGAQSTANTAAKTSEPSAAPASAPTPAPVSAPAPMPAPSAVNDETSQVLTASTAKEAQTEAPVTEKEVSNADRPTVESSRPGTAVLNRDNLEQHDQINALAFNQNQQQQQQHHHHHLGHTARKPSMSTEADRMSFNTAFTDADQTDHFVTPKPSLGDGGLRQFANQDNAETEGQGQMTPKAGEKTRGDVTPTANGHSTPQLVHEQVTMTSYIGGGL